MSDATPDPTPTPTPKPEAFDELLRVGFESVPAEPRDFTWLVDALHEATSQCPAEDAPPPPIALTGEVAPYDRYDIVDKIGEGGMGAVYRGRDPHLRRDVAIKVLGDRHADDGSLVHRFIEEAQVGGQLQHPGIVPVHEVGYRGDGRPYFTMKLVEGKTLGTLLRERTSPRDDSVRLLTAFEQICQTMAYAHSRDVVHRDLKPANVMIGRFGEVQIMDWGLAKVLHAPDDLSASLPRTVINTVRSESDATRSQSGSVMGTPGYMPPEQARGEVESTDARADVFSLGAILCEILTGHPAFRGSPSVQREQARGAELDDAFRRIADADVDAPLAAIARDALAADPADRPADAAVLAERLTRYRTARDERLREAELAATRARMRSVIIATLASLTVIAALAILWWQRQRLKDERALATRVTHAITETRDALGLARDRDEASAWAAARAAAKRAVSVAEQVDIPPEDHRRLIALIDQVAHDADEARDRRAARERDAAFCRALDHVQLVGLPFDGPARADRFHRMFRQHGLDLTTATPTTAAAHIGRSRIRPALLRGLDAWLLDAIRYDPRLADALALVANAADPEPAQVALRTALIARDAAAAARIAREARLGTHTTSTVALCASFLIAVGDTAGARAILEPAVDAHPEDFWLNVQLQRLASVEGELDAALEAARILRALRPESPVVWARLSDACRLAGRIDDAQKAALRGIALDDRCTTAHLALGLARRKAGDLDGAVRALEQAVECAEHEADATWHLAESFQRAGQSTAAESAYERVVALQPGHVLAWERLATLREKSGDVDGALAAFHRVIEHDTRPSARPATIDAAHRAKGFDVRETVANAWHAVGRLHERRRDPAAADAAYVHAAEATRDLGNRIDAWQAVAKLRRRASDPTGERTAWLAVITAATPLAGDESASDARRAGARNNAARAHFEVARLDRGRGAPREAERHYRTSMTLTDRPHPRVHLAALLFDLGRYADAERLAQTVADEHDVPLAWGWLGQCLEARGRHAEAREAYAEARGFPRAIIERCRQKEQAVAVLDDLGPAKDWPTHPRRLRLLAAAAHDIGRFALAARLHEHAVTVGTGTFDDLERADLSAAARSAGRAANGEGDASALPDAQRARWRRRAVEWLAAAVERAADDGLTTIERTALGSWKTHTAFRSVWQTNDAPATTLRRRIDALLRP